MNRKQKIILSVVGITIVLLTLLGLTYAYFLTRIQGNTNEKSISVTTADLKLVYGDGNGLIEAKNIMPGTTLTTKKYTVKNEGNTKVDNYVVYLEELVNVLTRVDDMVYTLTCTSDKAGNLCSGKTETTFPKLAGMIVTNSIDVGETQSYELTVTYKEMNVDQSDDMNKKISARVQIYNLTDIVNITGTVTNASEGDYVELHSEPKKSQIVNNKYLIAAVEPGTHTIYVKDKEGNVRGSKEITIKKGSTESINGSNITITKDSQIITVNIEKTKDGIDTVIEEINGYNPYKDNINSLAYNIINNSLQNKNGTEFRVTPLTFPAKETNSKFIKGNDPDTFALTLSNPDTYYISFADDYMINSDTGKLTLGSASTKVKTIKYSSDIDINLLKGKYAFWSTDEVKAKSYQNISTIYKISNVDSDITSSSIKYSNINVNVTKTKSIDNSLSITSDKYGTSYYYRGNVLDNYINFASMCWRIVRIQGDGSVKLILEDKDNTCETSNGNWNIPTTTEGTVNTGNIGYTQYAIGKLTASDGTTNTKVKYVFDYLHGTTNADKSMATAFKNFQSSLNENEKNILKIGDWCINNDGYTKDISNDIISFSKINKNNILDYYVKNTVVYYDTNVRLTGFNDTYNPSLICNGAVMNDWDDLEKTPMYVGTITADEAVYAGAKYTLKNESFYLLNDYQLNNGYRFLTLSPYSIGTDALGGNAFRPFIIYSRGSLGNLSVVDNNSFRPSVVLKSDISITNGDGTKNNPYKISE